MCEDRQVLHTCRHLHENSGIWKPCSIRKGRDTVPWEEEVPQESVLATVNLSKSFHLTESSKTQLKSLYNTLNLFSIITPISTYVYNVMYTEFCSVSQSKLTIMYTVNRLWSELTQYACYGFAQLRDKTHNNT